MPQNHPPADPGTPSEGVLREQLAAFFLSLPPFHEQTAAQRREYLKKLHQLGQLERQALLNPTGSRPLVWGNPAPLLQALLSTAQRLGAGLGQPILLFPAKDTAIGWDTLLHPRLLSIGAVSTLCSACLAAPKQSVWVRMQEQRDSLSVTITATVPFVRSETVAILKECTKLHDGSLVHDENTVRFSCGCISAPPPGVRLYCCPTEEDLLQDMLSPVWSCFYAELYSALSSSAGDTSS